MNEKSINSNIFSASWKKYLEIWNNCLIICEMHSSGGQVYASMKLSGDSYHNIYRINADGTYMRLTDDTGDFLRPRASRNGKYIGYIKSNGTQTVCVKDLIANTETAAEVFPYEAEIDIVGWNRSSSNLVYTVVVNTLGGGSCINPEIAGVRYYEIGAKLYSTELNNVSDLGLYYTVDKKMRYDTISGEEVLMYSRYEGRGNGSSVYMVKTGVRRVLSEHVDAYPYTGGIIGNDAEDHLEYEPAAEALAEMKLTPYKGLNGEPIIKYLYTGREYNTETGDYYYRARIYDQSVGRFGGKDYKIENIIGEQRVYLIYYYCLYRHIQTLNEYTYIGNKPAVGKDSYGLEKESFGEKLKRCGDEAQEYCLEQLTSSGGTLEEGLLRVSLGSETAAGAAVLGGLGSLYGGVFGTAIGGPVGGTIGKIAGGVIGASMAMGACQAGATAGCMMGPSMEKAQ